MDNKGSRIRNITLFALVTVWSILHVTFLLLDIIKNSKN